MASQHSSPVHPAAALRLPPQHYQYSWVVDPLDGTKEFIKRNGQFTVNIALLHGSRPVLGVVQVPAEVGWAASAHCGSSALPGGLLR